MIEQILKTVLQKIYVFASNTSRCRHWLLYTVLLSFCISLLMSFPRKEIYWHPNEVPEFDAVMKKAEVPFKQMNFGEGTHQAKLSFRLTVPLAIHIFHMDIALVKIMEYAFGILFFYLTARLIYQASGRKRDAFFLTLASGLIFPGTTSFVEFRGTFDGIAICLLLFAMLFGTCR